jgi:hypothetical protein
MLKAVEYDSTDRVYDKYSRNIRMDSLGNVFVGTRFNGQALESSLETITSYQV